MISKSLKTAAVTAMALGSVLTPTAFAADRSPTHHYREGQKAIYLNGKLVSRPIGIVARDPNTHRFTTYMPIWYVFHALKAVGVQFTWSRLDLNVKPAPGMTVNLANLHPGNEPVGLSINGTLVDTTHRIVARDPYSHVETTYMPIFYVQYTLRRMGVENTWNGHEWNLTVQTNTPQSLSISPAATTVGVGQSDTLTTQLTSSNGQTTTLSSNQITWTTNDSKDAFVSPSGQFIASKPGTYTVTASYEGISKSIQIQVFGSTQAIQLKANGSLVANGVSTENISVVAVDANGIQAQNENGTVTITSQQPWLVTGSNNGTNTLGTSVTVTLKNGIGSVAIQAPKTPGVSTELTASSLSDAASGSTIQYGTLQVTSVAQVATALSVQPTNGEKYLVSNQSGNQATFDVSVLDQTGNPMLTGSYPYNISVTGNATYTGPTTGVYAPGQTTPSITVLSKQGESGPVTVTVSGNGLKSASTTIQAIIAQQASKIVATSATGSNSFPDGGSVTMNLTAEDSSGVPTSYPSVPLTAYVTDAQGQPATDIRVNGVTESQSGVALGSSHSLAISTVSGGSPVGTYNVTIKDGSGNTWSSFQVNETAATTSKLSLSAASTELGLENPTVTLTLQYTDAYGNPTAPPAGTGPVTIKATGGQGTATINGQDATQGVQVNVDSSGKATVTFNAQAYAGSKWTLSSTDGHFTSNSVTISLVSAMVSQAQVALKDGKTGSTTQATAGDPLSVTFSALDTYNNPYSGNDVFSATYPTMALQGVTNGTSSNGTTTVTGTLAQLNKDFTSAKVSTAQTLTIQLTDTMVSSAKTGSASIVVVPGPFKGFALFNGNNQVIDSQDPLSITQNSAVELFVRPVDAMDNPVGAAPSSYTVDLGSKNGGAFRQTATGADISQIPFPIGASEVPVYYVNQNGQYGTLFAQISAFDASNSSVKLSNYTAYQGKTKTDGHGTLTVVLKDQNGLPVTGQSGNLTAAASTGDVSIGSFTEDPGTPGVYTATVTSTANHTDVTITVKDRSTTVGTTGKFSS